MAFVTATDIGRVHFEDIQVQHNRLTGYAVRLAELGEGRKREALLSEFNEYFRLHAADEEQFMRDNDYFGLDEHAAEHERILDLLGSGPADVLKTLENHLAHHDQPYLDHFCAAGLIPAGTTLRSSDRSGCAAAGDP